ncbi:unnamed protein product [Microthlaspi erraticum]|uniref:Uncharacterized protein n=1 Tax=Microthlaspi erraticum TaxID=1685480 RepID=A0A6D2I4X1_9BRAS|nr:unnamed protein product [Microthlaspi erraticum]
MADGFCRGRAIWSAKFGFGRENSAVAERMFPGSTGTVGPFRYKNFGRSRSFLSRFARGARTFSVAQVEISGRARLIPSRLDRDGRPDWNLLGQNSLLRVRGQCFGADCVFTPFSPSILS